MVIRKATPIDIPELCRSAQHCAPDEGRWQLSMDSTYPNPEVFQQDLDLGQLWVARIDGEVGGASSITTEQYPNMRCGAHITERHCSHRAAVDTKFRGMGTCSARVEQQSGIHQPGL